MGLFSRPASSSEGDLEWWELHLERMNGTSLLPFPILTTDASMTGWVQYWKPQTASTRFQGLLSQRTVAHQLSGIGSRDPGNSIVRLSSSRAQAAPQYRL